MSKDNKIFDLEDCLIDFAIRIIQVAESLPKTKAGNHKTSQLVIPCSTCPQCLWADLRWHLSLDVNATIIIPYLNTLHGRRVFDIHTLAVV